MHGPKSIDSMPNPLMDAMLEAMEAGLEVWQVNALPFRSMHAMMAWLRWIPMLAYQHHYPASELPRPISDSRQQCNSYS